MNKADLRDPRHTEAGSRAYEALGYQVLTVSATNGSGQAKLGALTAARHDKISAFVGPSGVGKSSLINRILPELELNTASVSDHHGKGRHTTRVATLHALREGGFLADTPGIRELGTWALPIEHLDRCFPELAAYRDGCTFRSCSHTHEPQCAVMDAVTAGDIDPERYESYVRLREEAGS